MRKTPKRLRTDCGVGRSKNVGSQAELGIVEPAVRGVKNFL